MDQRSSEPSPLQTQDSKASAGVCLPRHAEPRAADAASSSLSFRGRGAPRIVPGGTRFPLVAARSVCRQKRQGLLLGCAAPLSVPAGQTPKDDCLVSANSGQKPTFQLCRLARNPSTYTGGHGGDGVGPGAGSPNPSLYRSLPPDCPTVVVVRADHAAAAPGREGARSVAPRQRVRPLLLEAVFHDPWSSVARRMPRNLWLSIGALVWLAGSRRTGGKTAT